MSELLARAIAWYSQPDAPRPAEEVCATRDQFQARLDGALRGLLALGWSADEAALLVALLGEVGNNCFDHNLGQWRDVPGCWFGREAELEPARFCVMDRGVGILDTLRRADPTLHSAQEAVDAAFERVLSGRAPERRGNGLKFVRSVVNGEADRALICQSGEGRAAFGGLQAPLAEARARLGAVHPAGVALLLVWRRKT